MATSSVRELAHALRGLCRFAFSEDPYVEIGKLVRLPLEPEAWTFYIYVMTSSTSSNGDGRTLQRSNIILVTNNGVDVKGPDEYEIGQIFKEPVL